MKYTVGTKVRFTVPWFLGQGQGAGTVAHYGVYGSYAVELDIPLQLTLDGVTEDFSELLLREEALEAL